jgi:hypothetical protein
MGCARVPVPLKRNTWGTPPPLKEGGGGDVPWHGGTVTGTDGHGKGSLR